MTQLSDDSKVSFTIQQLADIKRLIGIAVWIRSEQMAQRDVVVKIRSKDFKADMPSTHHDTRMLMVENCMLDLENGKKYWQFLHDELHAWGVQPEPSWLQKRGDENDSETDSAI